MQVETESYTFCFAIMSLSEVLTSLFLFNEEFSLSSTQYKKTFAFLWQGKASPSISNIITH